MDLAAAITHTYVARTVRELVEARKVKARSTVTSYEVERGGRLCSVRHRTTLYSVAKRGRRPR
jgi:hypothetical protein